MKWGGISFTRLLLMHLWAETWSLSSWRWQLFKIQSLIQWTPFGGSLCRLLEEVVLQLLLQTLTKKITEGKAEMETFCSCSQKVKLGPRPLSSQRSWGFMCACTHDHGKTHWLRNWRKLLSGRGNSHPLSLYTASLLSVTHRRKNRNRLLF